MSSENLLVWLSPFPLLPSPVYKLLVVFLLFWLVVDLLRRSACYQGLHTLLIGRHLNRLGITVKFLGASRWRTCVVTPSSGHEPILSLLFNHLRRPKHWSWSPEVQELENVLWQCPTLLLTLLDATPPVESIGLCCHPGEGAGEGGQSLGAFAGTSEPVICGRCERLWQEDLGGTVTSEWTWTINILFLFWRLRQRCITHLRW